MGKFFERRPKDTPELRARLVDLAYARQGWITDLARQHRVPENALRQWVEQAELDKLEREARGYREEEIEISGGLFSQFGQDLPEPRRLDAVLWHAIDMAQNEGRWAEAMIVFRDRLTAEPDYDAPRSWQVIFLQNRHRVQVAIDLAKLSAIQCRRKSLLLWYAADYALRIGEVRKAIHHCVQCIAALTEPPDRGQATRLNAFLMLGELLDVFGDLPGARWAREAQNFILLTDHRIEEIRRAAMAVRESERARIMDELPAVMGDLRARVDWLA